MTVQQQAQPFANAPQRTAQTGLCSTPSTQVPHLLHVAGQVELHRGQPHHSIHIGGVQRQYTPVQRTRLVQAPLPIAARCQTQPHLWWRAGVRNEGLLIAAQATSIARSTRPGCSRSAGAADSVLGFGVWRSSAAALCAGTSQSVLLQRPSFSPTAPRAHSWPPSSGRLLKTWVVAAGIGYCDCFVALGGGQRKGLMPATT